MNSRKYIIEAFGVLFLTPFIQIRSANAEVIWGNFSNQLLLPKEKSYNNKGSKEIERNKISKGPWCKC